jgi:aspartate aminotransferase-like enzyme
VPDEALLAMARPVPHHRTPEFRALMAEVLDGLKYVFQTQNDVAVLTSSGTGAMEAAVVNLVPRGGKALVLESGKFSERWSEICRVFGIEVIAHKVPWGEPFRADDVAALLRQHPDCAAVFTTLMETSTGVGHDIEAIGRVVGPTNALFVVDGISGAGVVECRTDAWHIDVLVVGAQKALMVPPGLAFLSISAAAWKQIESFDRPAFYFDLRKYRKGLAQSETPFTPAIPQVLALAENLKRMRGEGMEAIWARGKLLSRATLAGIEVLGLKSYASRPATGMTAVCTPASIDASAVAARLQSRFGLKVAGGQGQAKGKIFRIAHMGILDELDILSTIAAIELVLVEMGQTIKLGSGVGAASLVLAEAAKTDRRPKGA